MTEFYENMAKTALKQIADKGREITVRRPGEGQVYDPSNDTFTAATPVDETVKALFTNFSKNDVDGEKIKRTDKRVLIAGASLDMAPDTDHKIIDGGVTYNVINTDVVQPGDTVLLYMVQVRK
ncbi:hypothetical protein [Micavibrio aeruginosavorus]|uniref:Phage protein n=1 Tax=Micavibrio aeruginosavorus (strain ARL-13) TaxID=856793 RepID=G2KMW0_MICAA|nr:hypothetical protein [Micavibrio aeruginosavorus]AEP08892.1 hypothetical protein MICA_555 [Micavibrio aeruginosavorus ARL-13]